MSTTARTERHRIGVFSAYAFILLVCYYILKTLREPLLLENGSAELKSYAYAAIAVLLLFLVPLHAAVFRRTTRRQLLRWTTVFFAANLSVFYCLGRAGADIGFVYYVWVGVFSLMTLAQFWAHAAHVFGIDRGPRVFPIIMASAAIGGLVGPALCDTLFAALGAWNLMLLAIGLLVATLPLIASMRVLPGPLEPTHESNTSERNHSVLGGFALVASDRYLLLLAGLAVLLNCVGTTGEYMLTELVLRHADAQLAVRPDLDRDVLIADFYAGYFLSVNVLTVTFQMLLVGRLFRWIGIHGAVLVLPIIALVGYGLIAFIPIFGIIRAVKILESSVDYSLMNTARHALYLPLPTAHKYQGKTAVDTFFWRLGDLVQAAIVYVGLNWLGFEFQDFALLNMLLALLWAALAIRIGGQYRRQVEPDFRPNWRGFGAAVSAAALACMAGVLPASAAADGGGLFKEQQPLRLEIRFDRGALCRAPDRKGCEDVPAQLAYTSTDGVVHEVEASLRTRGRWRKETGHCSLPALFVFFSPSTTRGTLFEGQTMLPLTTHCKDRPTYYEQYVFKEYLAYRLYNDLTDKSLRVRLAQITYRDTGKSGNAVERAGFFTEHFESLAARNDAQVWRPERFDPLQADPLELGILELFQYMIGNTDWSATYGHNIVLIKNAQGLPTAIPYDFDFSGLVGAEYAGPSPKLRIRNVTERLFRGFCSADRDWNELFAQFAQRAQLTRERLAEIETLAPKHRAKAAAYLEDFFGVIGSPDLRQARIVDACRFTAAN